MICPLNPRTNSANLAFHSDALTKTIFRPTQIEIQIATTSDRARESAWPWLIGQSRTKTFLPTWLQTP